MPFFGRGRRLQLCQERCQERSSGRSGSEQVSGQNLADEQRAAHDCLADYVIESVRNPDNPPRQVRAIILGTAGTGKSYLVRTVMATISAALGSATTARKAMRVRHRF